MSRLLGCLLFIACLTALMLAPAQGQPVPNEVEDQRVKPPPPPVGVAGAARRDALGDPLPAGAVARLGSQRLKHTNRVIHLTFSPDGKQLVTVGDDNLIRIWDAHTGAEV